MSRLNYNKLRIREVMGRRGYTSSRQDAPEIFALLGRPPRRRPLSKAELRQQAADAFLDWRKRQPNIVTE